MCFVADVHCRCSRYFRKYSTKNFCSKLLCKSKRRVLRDCLGVTLCGEWEKISLILLPYSLKLRSPWTILRSCACQAVWWVLVVVTKRRNDLQPPKTTYNHLKPPTTIYNHLEKFNNHLQPPQKHLQPPTNKRIPS